MLAGSKQTYPFRELRKHKKFDEYPMWRHTLFTSMQKQSLNYDVLINALPGEHARNSETVLIIFKCIGLWLKKILF